MVLAILGPIYFLLLMLFLPFRIEPFTDPVLNLLFHHIVVPIIFSAPWVGGIYYTRYRLANTVQLMQETTTTVPLRWRIFYGINAAFVMTFFVLPMIIAPIAIIGGLVVAGRVFYTIGIGKFGNRRGASILGGLAAIALCILPGYIMLQFIPNYLLVWEGILGAWSSFWFTVVYGIAQCLVNALSFGAPVYFLYFAAKEYDRGVYGVTYSETPTNWIRFGELILFLIFVYIYLPPVPLVEGITIPFLNLAWLFTSYVNWISLGIVVLMILIRRIVGVKNDTTLGGPLNIAIVGMFLIVELFFKTDLLIVTLVIWLAFLLFSGVLVANYLRASPRELY